MSNIAPTKITMTAAEAIESINKDIEAKINKSKAPLGDFEINIFIAALIGAAIYCAYLALPLLPMEHALIGVQTVSTLQLVLFALCVPGALGLAYVTHKDRSTKRRNEIDPAEAVMMAEELWRGILTTGELDYLPAQDVWFTLTGGLPFTSQAGVRGGELETRLTTEKARKAKISGIKPIDAIFTAEEREKAEQHVGDVRGVFKTLISKVK